MRNLAVGDKVLVSYNTYSPILAWADYNQEKKTAFITLRTVHSSLTLTPNHNVFVLEEGRNVSKYARDVVVGDLLVYVNRGETARVTKVTTHVENGYYNPLTEEGTIVVDGVLTSCYGSYPHWLAHLAMTPARWFPNVFLAANPDGTLPYINMIKKIGNLLNVRGAAAEYGLTDWLKGLIAVTVKAG